jgi:monofunctional biosynthetic peptidoglycan transglycosylase
MSMKLVDFTDSREASRWRPIDDVVMGGQSASSVTGEGQTGVFSGAVSLARGGGFASVRRQNQVFDLSGFEVLLVRARGDGRRYKLNLRCSERFDGVVFQAPFDTMPGDWQSIQLPLEGFEPRYRGRPAAGTLDLAHVVSVGLVIADRQAGPFRLEVASIAAIPRKEPQYPPG